MENYVVQYGDTLPLIAKKELSNQDRWLEIARLNNIESPYQLLVGQTIKLPNRISMFIPQLPAVAVEHKPATMAWARGLMFVVFEQLPNVGSNKVIRKVAVTPKNYALAPKNPSANFSAAEHAFMGDKIDTQFLSTSNRPYGAPKYQGEPMLIDLNMVKASGTQIYTEQELILELRRYSAQTGVNVDTLIQTIQKAEGEVLIKGGVSGDAVRKISNAHTPYIQTAEEIWSKFEAKKITRPQMEAELELLAKAYNKAKIVGRVGRVLTVIGVVFTAVDVANAAQKSYDKGSYKPLAAETVRQVGGWSGAYTGSLAGAEIGILLTSETGPGAIIGGAVGAIIFGGIGYWRGDVLAGWIESEETTTELRKDVRSTDSMKTKGIKLIVGRDETQYDFCRRALLQAALLAQLFSPSERNAFVEAFYPLNKSIEERLKVKANWVSGDPNPRDGSDIKSAEWEKLKGTEMTYYLNDAEIKELVRRLLNR